MPMRRLGVYGENLPTKKERAVNPADFAIAGLYGNFGRKYDKTFRFRNPAEAAVVLGAQVNPADYGWDVINGFFANLQGQPGSIIVAPYKGTGAVQASVQFGDSSNMYFKASAAYQGEKEYGALANRTGFTVTRGSAFSATIVSITGTAVKLESVAGITAGDLLTDGTDPFTVVSVDESASTVTLSAVTGLTAGDVLSVIAYQIKTYLRSAKGAVEEVETTLGKAWVTMNKSDPNRYLLNVFNTTSSYLFFEEVADVPDTGLDDTTVVKYLENGADGARPATVSAFESIWPMMDFQPMRMCAACETSNMDIQKSLETYCMNREDNPIVMIVGQMGLETKNQVMAAGQAFQRSSEVDAVYIHNWLVVPDPFVDTAIPIKRNIPNVGHTMGQWIHSIGASGIHMVPSRKELALKGVSGVLGYQALNDYDRTELAEAGVNIIQQMTGRGVVVRNHFTPSTAAEFRYSNGLIMRNFIKVSVVDALQDSENSPNSINRVMIDRQATLQFMHKLWARGSNGSVVTGETFGQYMLEDGSLSTTDDAFEVIGDATNNDVGTLQRGERNIDVYFQFPAPAGSIKIGVGILYKVV